MRQSSSVLALVALAACNPQEPNTGTDSGATQGGESGKVSLDTTATSALTTRGSTTTATTPGAPVTTSSTSSASSTSSTSSTSSISSISSTSTTADTDASSHASPTTDSAASATTGELTTGAGTTGAGPIDPWKPKGCPAIYAQDLLPTFELQFAKDELSKIKSEWKGLKNDAPEHPLESFQYEDTIITTATARLRGSWFWWPDMGKKMQLEVSFNSVDPKGRFMGQRRLVFDAARYNESFLRDRLAMSMLQDVGVPTPCANNARVMLNGEYLGLFTSIEKVDKEFPERHFEAPEGNPYQRNDWEKKTNEKDMNISDMEALLAAKTVDQLLASMNLEEVVLELAAEAVMPDGDGAWAGGLNAYYYNDPGTRFNLIPWDMDSTFARLPFDTDPYTYLKPSDHGRPFYDIVTDDPVWFKKYIEKIEYVLVHGYDVEVLQGRMDTWAAQIATAVAEDSNKPFSTSDHLLAVQEQRDYIAQRHAFIKTWLECWQKGGSKGKNGKCKPA